VARGPANLLAGLPRPSQCRKGAWKHSRSGAPPHWVRQTWL